MNHSDYENTPSVSDASAEEVTPKAKRLKMKRPELKKELKEFDGYCYIASFLLPFLIMLGVYACLGKHPFGNGSVLTLDLQAQYVYYFEAIRRLLTEGGSWLYSFARTLGGEFMGIVAYYGSSPFNLIFVLFPKDMLADAVMFMQLAKVGAMGLTFAYYLRKTRRTSDMITVSFAMMYALCSYSVVELMNPMWLDAMVFLPLLVLGIESMIRERRFILYTSSLALIFITNYYIGYMCCIFTLAYYFYYYFLVFDELPQNLGATNGNFVKKILHSRGLETLIRFGVFSVIAALISAFMLLCAWYSLQFGKTDFSNPSFNFDLRFDFLDIFVKLLPGSYDTVRPNGLPMIYSGMLALIALPLFFMSKTISAKKKALTGALLIFFLVSFSVNIVDLVWHGFSAPNWLNYRYSFLFSFVLIVLACDAIRGLKKIPFGWIASVGTVIALLVLVVQKLGYSFAQSEGKTKVLDDAKCIVVSLVLVGIYLFILRYMKYDNMEKTGAFALAIVVCVEMFATALITVGDVQLDVGSVQYDNYLSDNGKTEYYSGYKGAIRRIEDVVNEILEKDTSLYRMESTVYRREGGVNEPMAFGFNGISHSTSTLNEAVIDFMKMFGYASQSHWTKYIGGTPVSDALLGIKYVITKNDKLDSNIYTVAAEGPEVYQYIPTENTIYAMQNTKALPLVYGVSPDVATELGNFNNPPYNYRSALESQNELVNVMLSGVMDTPNVLRGIYAEFDVKDCKYSTYTHNVSYLDEDGEKQKAPVKHHVFTPKDGVKSASVTYVFEAEADGPVYFHVGGISFADISSNCQIYVNGKKICNYFTNETWVIQNLGTFEKGDMVKVEIVFSDGKLYYSRESECVFYYIDYEAMNEAFEQLEYASMYVEGYASDAHFKGTINLPAGQDLIFTSISYDAGWKVYIDGEEAETIKVLGTLLAIPSTEGFHEIEFVYRPSCAVYGGILSVFGILLFAAVIAWSILSKKRTRVSTNGGSVHFFYHKGDETMDWLLEAAEEEAANAPDALQMLSKQKPEESVSDMMAENESETKVESEEQNTDIISEE